MRKLLALALAVMIATSLAKAALGFGLGLGTRFGKLGVAGGIANITPPPTCAGVIDASVGCPLPMLGM